MGAAPGGGGGELVVGLGDGDGEVGVGDGEVGVGDGEVGVGDGVVGVGDGVGPLQVVPLSVNAVGVALVPLLVKFPPIWADALVPRLPFQLALATVMFLPLCVQVPLQPWDRV